MAVIFAERRLGRRTLDSGRVQPQMGRLHAPAIIERADWSLGEPMLGRPWTTHEMFVEMLLRDVPQRRTVFYRRWAAAQASLCMRDLVSGESPTAARTRRERGRFHDESERRHYETAARAWTQVSGAQPKPRNRAERRAAKRRP